MASQIRLDDFHNLLQIKQAKSQDLTVLRTNLGTGSSIKSIRKLAKTLTETSNKMHKPKTYNKTIDNLIYRNKWYKVIYKKLQNLDLYQIWYYEK